MHNVLHVKCSQWPWYGLCCCCNLWHRWHQESAGQDLLELPLCSLALQDLNSGHEIPNAASPFCPFSQKGNLGACESGFAGAVCVRARDRAPVPLSCCCLPRHLGHGAVFCWAWVTLAEMSAEPALALSAFTVSCKVNRMLLCGGKCYSLKSSWRRLSIRPVQKWARSQGVLFCWSSAVCAAPGSCAAPLGSSARMLWVPFETFPVSHRMRLLSSYWVGQGLAFRTGWSHELCFVEGRSCLTQLFCVCCVLLSIFWAGTNGLL